MKSLRCDIYYKAMTYIHFFFFFKVNTDVTSGSNGASVLGKATATDWLSTSANGLKRASL